MGLENLTDVHTGRNAEGVQHDLDRTAVFHVGHVLFRKYPGDDTLVPVPPCHLVADLELSLDGNVDLDHLDDTGRKIVAALQLLDLVIENEVDEFDLLGQGRQDLGDLFFHALPIGNRYLVPSFQGERGKVRGSDLLPLGDYGLSLAVLDRRGRDPVQEKFRQLVNGSFADDLDLVLFILAQLFLLGALDALGAGVLVGALAGENLGADDRAFHAWRYPEGSVAHIAGLFAENRPEELFLG